VTEPTIDEPFYAGPVRWLLNPSETELEGFVCVGWSDELAGWVAQARRVGMQRPSLENAAHGWLEWLDQVD
jgi:hypothetical protein